MNHQKKIILLFVIALLLIIPFAMSEERGWTVGGLLGARTSDHFLETGWYNVTDEEILICSRTLETEIEGELDYSSAEFDSNSFVYDTAVTLQALKTSNSYDDQILYELGWYVHPVEDDDNFYVEVQQDNAQWIKIVEDQTANPAVGNMGYHSWYDTKNYVRARIVYSEGTFEVPFAE